MGMGWEEIVVHSILVRQWSSGLVDVCVLEDLGVLYVLSQE